MNIAKNFLINRDKPDIWKSDISKSVDLYNSWFMKFAPKEFRETRLITIGRVESTLKLTNYLSTISHNLLKEHPEILQILRMSTCPPIARDRLIGLARVSKTLIASMEDKSNPHIPTKILIEKIDNDLILICNVIKEMIDPDIFVWLDRPKKPAKVEIKRAATIVADRLCGALSDPIIRNAQETRQLDAIKEWLQVHDYLYIKKVKYNQMEPGTFCFRANIPILRSNRGNKVNINIPIDVLIMPKNAVKGDFPL
ncbi:MAG: XamI family restriction endonuclease, partial [Deltaproteobacteria bacterium]|nr:XamI family restriction endonuclease [Deltaproteobacteria bacterium]